MAAAPPCRAADGGEIKCIMEISSEIDFLVPYSNGGRVKYFSIQPRPFEALESSTLWMKEKMEETIQHGSHARSHPSVTNATEENEAVEGMRQDLQAVLARLGGGPNGDNRVQPPRVEEEQLVDGRETHISESTRGEPRPRQPLRLGGRVENEHEVVERWLRRRSLTVMLMTMQGRRKDSVGVGMGRKCPMAGTMKMLEDMRGREETPL
ncbi:hypothetical protein CJ030_MR8G011178 [Morella rubra]|uniref:Uncharacterized protein n=1 Tax=Morella rubra TaxID=262757 RepID=A0A6A1UXF4_9ROSI|nr:hypothetical protein CJ030_MR8G011178 [Morella rubra]